MKRSEINAAISEAKDMIDRYSWVLPKWGYWSKEEYNNNPNLKNYLKAKLSLIFSISLYRQKVLDV